MYDRAMKALERLRKEAANTQESELNEELRNDAEPPEPEEIAEQDAAENTYPSHPDPAKPQPKPEELLPVGTP